MPSDCISSIFLNLKACSMLHPTAYALGNLQPCPCYCYRRPSREKRWPRSANSDRSGWKVIYLTLASRFCVLGGGGHCSHKQRAIRIDLAHAVALMCNRHNPYAQVIMDLWMFLSSAAASARRRGTGADLYYCSLNHNCIRSYSQVLYHIMITAHNKSIFRSSLVVNLHVLA